MTDTEAALLAALAAHPDEDTPRLVFADYLQEQGDDDRAEFIRVQCELAKLVLWSGHFLTGEPIRVHYDALRARESALLNANRERWLRVGCPTCGGSGRLPGIGAGVGGPVGAYLRATARAAGVDASRQCHYCDGTGDIGGLAPWTCPPGTDTAYPYDTIWRRGFPFAVQGCRLADCFERPEQPCPRCNQSLWSRGQMGNWSGCECGGRGVVAGEWQPTTWLLRVLAAHPTLTRVPLVDRVPYLDGAITLDGAVDTFDWHSAVPPDGTESAVIPQPLFDAMKANRPNNVTPIAGGGESIEHPTAEAAHDLLAVAVVTVAAPLARGAA